MKEEEYRADLQMMNHFDVGMEIKVLDLMLENAQLKNQVANTTAALEELKERRTSATSNDFSSFERDAFMQQLESKSRSVKSRGTRVDSPVLRRRFCMTFLSRFRTKQLTFFKLSAYKRRSFCTHIQYFSDDLSDLSSITLVSEVQ
jgi:hypothetical protein